MPSRNRGVIFFTVIDGRVRVPDVARNRAFLYRDNWDDWGKYRTMISLHIADEEGDVHNIDSVKIGQRGLRPPGKTSENHRFPSLPDECNELGEDFFSLGQGEDYYESLNKLSDALRARVFKGLRDCAADLTISHAFADEDVMRESLMRDAFSMSITGRLNRLVHQHASLET